MPKLWKKGCDADKLLEELWDGYANKVRACEETIKKADF